MTLFHAMDMSSSGLNAQRAVMDTVSMNLANVQTTRTETGEPYRRKRAVLAHSAADQPFEDILLNRIEVLGQVKRTHPDHFPQTRFLPWDIGQKKGGLMAETVEDPGEFKMVHDPLHPDANSEGYVLFPNINPIEEMVGLLGAVRSFEANVTAFNAAKSMVLKSLEIGR